MMRFVRCSLQRCPQSLNTLWRSPSELSTSSLMRFVSPITQALLCVPAPEKWRTHLEVAALRRLEFLDMFQNISYLVSFDVGLNAHKHRSCATSCTAKYLGSSEEKPDAKSTS